MKTELKKRARAYYLGFLFFCACEAILNIYYLGKLRELFNSAPDEVVLMNFLIYGIMAVGFAVGLLYCLYQSKNSSQKS